MILDDLFNQAAKDAEKAGTPTITIEASVTTNQTGGFKSTTNRNAAQTPTVLTYTKQRRRGGATSLSFTPASFSGNKGLSTALTITAPVPFPIGDTYSVTLGGLSFTPAVDLTTDVVYGSAGQALVTISLCKYSVRFPPK